jgi:glucokinase
MKKISYVVSPLCEPGGSKMNAANDPRVVMTLDAGGTNFVFSAIRSNKEIVEPITLPSNAHDLKLCLETTIAGFTRVMGQCPESPVAISFAFPGPADYPSGIIGDLPNLSAFRGGVPLGPMLEEKFRLPVFINNDGDLFAYGEAIAGLLPEINSLLEKAGSQKRYKNLLGVTLGTGFGGGIVRNGELFLGDNSGAAEIWLLRNKLDPGLNVEEGASIRAVQRAYANAAGLPMQGAPTPKEIYEIATGRKEGIREAALAAYRRLGEVVGDALANALTLIDGLAVVGGGLSGAQSMFFPSLIAEMNGAFVHPDGKRVQRLEARAFNLEDPGDLDIFLKGEQREIQVPGSNYHLLYDPLRRVGVGVTRLGTSRAVAVGAYAFALNALQG